MPDYYSNAPLEVKQKIIGSIFPEKLLFENKTYRTSRLNEVIRLLTSNINDFEDVKKEKVDKIADLSSMAPPNTKSLNSLVFANDFLNRPAYTAVGHLNMEKGGKGRRNIRHTDYAVAAPVGDAPTHKY
jgi:hypothetical protein